MNTIFLHGLGQTPSGWESTIASLPKHLNITCPNLYKLCQYEEITYEKLYSSFKDYCNQFSSPINLCGLSLGAILALNYAIDYPDRVKTLIVIAPQIKTPRLLLICQNIIFKFIPKRYFLMSGVNKEYLIQLSKSMMNLNLKNALKKVNCPVFVICGSKDYVNRKISKEIANLLQNATFHLIEGVGHEVNKDAPKTLSLFIQNFYKHCQLI